MMRESTIRSRRSHDGLLIVLGSLASLGPVSLGLAWLTNHGTIAWRSLFVQLSLIAAIPQSAALIAAVLRLAGRERFVTLRRAAEGVALALPVAILAHAGIIASTAALAAPGNHVSIVGPSLASLALGCSGIAFLASSLSSEVAAAIDRGETEGSIAYFLARLWPRGERYAPLFAYAYLALFTFCAPYLAHVSVAPLAATVTSSWLRGPYLAANDLVLALAVVMLAARVARDGDPYVMPLEDNDARRGSRALAFATLALGGFLLAQLCALVPATHMADLGILPTAVGSRAWIGLALFGLAIAHFVPAAGLLAPESQSPQSVLTAVCATLVVGAWAERAALLTPLHGSGFGAVDLFVSIAGVASAAICVIAAAGVIVIDDEFAGAPRRRQSTVAG